MTAAATLRNRVLRLFGLAAVLVGLIVAGRVSGLTEGLTLDVIRAKVESAGPLGSLVFLAGFTAGALLQVPGMLFVGAAILVPAIVCVRALAIRHPVDAPRLDPASAGSAPPPPWRGLSYIAKSPYLRGICAFTLFHTLFSTILYFQQAHLADGGVDRRCTSIMQIRSCCTQSP